MANTFPSIDLTIRDGALGGAFTFNDGVCGLIASCNITTATDPVISDGDEFTLNSIDDAKDAGLNQIGFVYDALTEFYNESGRGARLYLKVLSNLEGGTHRDLDLICDKADSNAFLKTFVESKQGDIKFAGVIHDPGEGYTLAVTNGFDDKAFTALAKANTYGADTQADFRPIFTILEGRAYQGDSAAATDLTTLTYDRAGLVVGHGAAGDTEGTSDLRASVGLVLGKIAAASVQRKISATADGALSETAMYLPDSNGDSVEINLQEGAVKQLTEKGYITFRSFVGQTGYYVADDPLANSTTSDYDNIANRRVLDKVIRIAYATYFDELNSDIEVDANGYIDAGIIKDLQAKIEDAVNLSMTGSGELSGFSAFIEPQQNVLATDKIQILLSPVPKGYLKTIDLQIGFDNPFN